MISQRTFWIAWGSFWATYSAVCWVVTGNSWVWPLAIIIHLFCLRYWLGRNAA